MQAWAQIQAAGAAPRNFHWLLGQMKEGRWLAALAVAAPLILDVDGLGTGWQEPPLSRKVMRSEESLNRREAAAGNAEAHYDGAGGAWRALTGLQFVCDQIPCPVTPAERKGMFPCSFVDEKGGLAGCNVESPEHELVRRHILANATVLELGGRYGTTTCEIAAVQRNSGNLVSVEPDPAVWDVWKKNTDSHGCAAKQLKQVVGSVARTRSEGAYGYDTRFSLSEMGLQRDPDLVAEAALGKAVPFSEVEARFQVKFDTLLIDCEGCAKYFFEDNPGMLEGIHTILLEADMGIYQGTKAPDCGTNCANYDLVISDLQNRGFSIVEHFREHFRPGDGRDDKGDHCPWINHFALKRDRTKHF